MDDLPAFSAILDAHEQVLLEADDYEPEEDETGTAKVDRPLARDWIDGLSTLWAGKLEDAPYVAPLAEIVRRVSALTGVPCPELDASEGPLDRVTVLESFNGEG